MTRFTLGVSRENSKFKFPEKCCELRNHPQPILHTATIIVSRSEVALSGRDITY